MFSTGWKVIPTKRWSDFRVKEPQGLRTGSHRHFGVPKIQDNEQ